jgi:hypothetical protein
MCFFRSISTARLERGVFLSVPERFTAIDEYIAVHKQNPKPFVWTAKANDTLLQVIRANHHLGSRRNETLHRLLDCFRASNLRSCSTPESNSLG